MEFPPASRLELVDDGSVIYSDDDTQYIIEATGSDQQFYIYLFKM